MTTTTNESKFLEVLDSKIHYLDQGEGTPFLFLHGNPTSNYLWRNIIPHVVPLGRIVAPDLIGMGKSGKPDIDYTFADHYRYMDAFIKELELQNVILVIHDWGSALGFNYAMQNPDNVKGIVFMEALYQPSSWKNFPSSAYLIFKLFRNPIMGKLMIMNRNFFVEKVLPKFTVRQLTKEEMDHYRQPYPDKKSRKPLYVWPNQIPIDGKPRETYDVVTQYNKFLQESEIPKLLLWAKPGAIITEQAVEWIKSHFKNLEDNYIGKSLHYVQEDQPDAIGKAIKSWYIKHF